ncbi:MAG: 30S ribosomal protein S7 [Oscillospiraceae bacterium]|jgi:small subunit ribosomal protein S7|nr:30S ribosomal protein S7 [Oscillospiraceae bacterium]
MPRRGAVPKREILPDPIYNSKLIAKLVNNIMVDGKYNIAQSIVYGSLKKVSEKFKFEPLEIFEKAMHNVCPNFEVKARRVGGATYQVPIEVRAERKQALGLRWIVSFAEKRSERTMVERLAGEIADAYSGIGTSVKKREDTHKMAEANKAFAHYRW